MGVDNRLQDASLFQVPDTVQAQRSWLFDRFDLAQGAVVGRASPEQIGPEVS